MQPALPLAHCRNLPSVDEGADFVPARRALELRVTYIMWPRPSNPISDVHAQRLRRPRDAANVQRGAKWVLGEVRSSRWRRTAHERFARHSSRAASPLRDGRRWRSEVRSYPQFSLTFKLDHPRRRSLSYSSSRRNVVRDRGTCTAPDGVPMLGSSFDRSLFADSGSVPCKRASSRPIVSPFSRSSFLSEASGSDSEPVGPGRKVRPEARCRGGSSPRSVACGRPELVSPYSPASFPSPRTPHTSRRKVGEGHPLQSVVVGRAGGGKPRGSAIVGRKKLITQVIAPLRTSTSFRVEPRPSWKF